MPTVTVCNLPIPYIPASEADRVFATVELRHRLDLDPAAIVVYDDAGEDGHWYEVTLAEHGGLTYLVRIHGADAPCDAIEAAIDAAIAAGHRGVFHDAEYPEQGPDESDEDFQRACERAEVDMHVVGHTTTPAGWGSWIPQWAITCSNARSEYVAYGDAFVEGAAFCDDDPEVDVDYDGSAMTDAEVCEYVVERALDLGYLVDNAPAFVGFMAGFSDRFCGGRLCGPFVPGQPTRAQRAQQELAEARMAALDAG